MEALAARAAALRTVELVAPRSVIGKNTVECLQSGVLYGFAGQVDGLVRRILAELGAGPVTVIGTGGLAPLIVDESETITEHVPDLTLLGPAAGLPAQRHCRVPARRPGPALRRPLSPFPSVGNHSLTLSRDHRAPRRPRPRSGRLELPEQIRVRRDKRAEMLAGGHEPYPVAVAADPHAAPRSAPPIRTCPRTPPPVTGSASPAG